MIPQIGLGSGRATKDLADAKKGIRTAIVENGYRMIDTAKIYGTEEIIGEVLEEIFAEGILARSDLYITTKLWPSDKGSVESALRTSLAALRLTYVDMYLLHWMTPVVTDWRADSISIEKGTGSQQVWAQMERMVTEGLCKGIGVSNCGVQMLMDMMTYCNIPPAIN
jgi:diketogulonate reductase-like aldo/keto reductase